MSPCFAPARAAPIRSTRPCCASLISTRIVGLLQRRRRIIGLLADLDVLVDARLEVRERLRIMVDRRRRLRARALPTVTAASTRTDEAEANSFTVNTPSQIVYNLCAIGAISCVAKRVLGLDPVAAAHQWLSRSAVVQAVDVELRRIRS